MKTPIIYSYFLSKLMAAGRKEIGIAEFRDILLNRTRFRREMWFEVMKELTEAGLIVGYESDRHVIVLKKKIPHRDMRRLKNILPME